MKHDRKRACLSCEPYVWDKYEVIQGAVESRDIIEVSPGFSVYHFVYAESYVIEDGRFSLVNPLAGMPADLTDLYWFWRSGRPPVVVTNPYGLILNKGTPVVDKTVFATITGYDAEVLTIGYGTQYWKVPYKYSLGSSPGNPVGTVMSFSFGAYPENGIKDGYWYIRR